MWSASEWPSHVPITEFVFLPRPLARAVNEREGERGRRRRCLSDLRDVGPSPSDSEETFMNFHVMLCVHLGAFLDTSKARVTHI